MSWVMCSTSSYSFFPSKLILFSLLLFLNVGTNILLAYADVDVESKVQIVYLGKRQHDDRELITSSHHDILSSVLGSREASAEAMIYSYRHGFSGFAAKLTKEQAQRIAELPGVVQVTPNQFYKLQTTRSWDYLGLSTTNSDSNLLNKAKMGDGVIIGVVDSGVWPENEAFNDKGMGPIPSRWKGICQTGPRFNATRCNRKLIGARFFADGLLAASPNTTIQNVLLSPRDVEGHGTHTASTAAGNFAPKASYNGLAFGTVRGGAPRARLAIYKLVSSDEGFATADLIKAMDQAIHDGVDVLSMSLGAELPGFPDFDKRDAVQFVSFHAVEKGIICVNAAGNSGPNPETVIGVSPWLLTVAASTIDRSFPTPIVLGNNQTLMGEAIYTGNATSFLSVTSPELMDFKDYTYCESLSANDTWITGHVILCFFLNGDEGDVVGTAKAAVQEAGGLGIIIAKNPSKTLDYFTDEFPTIQVTYGVGTQILNYIRYTKNPKLLIKPSITHIGKPVSTKVARFSCRGPNLLAPAVLKPDIAAPGVNILAAGFNAQNFKESTYAIMSGTSMATPHVSGIVALLKALHPDWSPAAFKSALVTTAWTTDPYSGAPILAEGDPPKVADSFDFGGGIVNPNKARDPGLVYDMGTQDYIHYLCAMGYNSTSIAMLTEENIKCPSKGLSILDLNFPSITIPSLRCSVTVTRTVTNVGPVHSTYKAIIELPTGINILVKPNVLVFDPKMKKIPFTVTISTRYNSNIGYLFGSLMWTDGVHKVRIPISVKTEYQEA